MDSGRVGNGRNGLDGRAAGRLILALVLAATLAASGPVSTADALTCQVRVSRGGKRICWCWDGRWVTAPMVLCWVAR